MTQENEIREAFESWYDSTHREPISAADRRTDGDYRLGISGLWKAWQAALAEPLLKQRKDSDHE